MNVALAKPVSTSATASTKMISVTTNHFLLYLYWLLFYCLCSKGGIYLIQLMDHHVCSGSTLLLLCLCQTVAIAWVYGKSRTTQPTNILLTKQTKLFFSICKI